MQTALSLCSFYETCWHNQHISVIVRSDELSNILAPSEPSTNDAVLIERHSHTIARAADSDTTIYRPHLYRKGKLVRIVWIVTALLRMSTVVDTLDLYGCEPLLDLLFELIASVV